MQCVYLERLFEQAQELHNSDFEAGYVIYS